MEETSNDKKEPVKVMLADDDKEGQEIFAEAVAESNIPVELTTADNGQELMDKLHDPNEPNPDVIFLDINMPVKDGKEALKEIKSDEELKDIPTVIYTASDSKKDIEDTFHAGANLYVTKPVSFRSLVSIIRKILTLDWKKYLPRPIRELFFVSDKDI
jgi:CheY-like chemotaxis protein